MATALYRRYRPETFAELIGQSQVTDPLRTALRNDRVNHAYLFSGPRGCGKTTSARILARCLNCVDGPTDTPCGVCPSCVELSRDGSGSMDVVEIDAASHGGVDDARDLRERAIFAPSRDRYKIFILDEAHMVTSGGFNALLKIVEEPPEHVKFIFATTEPDKVIGTIRSRTHHYPFRLVPPAQMLEYVHQLSESENVAVEPGVLPLVVRAGGGSVRDTLSLLDQLIAGSEGSSVQYERAVALLGYTHGALLSDVVDALGERNASSAFGAVDRVIQTGQDPRRFVEDLLERLRDLIVVSAYSGSTEAAAAVLRGIPQDELDHMAQQAQMFGTTELSRAADVVNAALTEMTGATSPRLHLELMIARVLIPASDATNRGALARVERLERRVGVETDAGVETPDAPAARAATQPVAAPTTPAPASAASTASPTVAPTAAQPAAASVAVQPPAEVPEPAAPAANAPVTLGQVKDAWPEILDAVQKAKRTAWMVVFNSHVVDLRDDVLVLSFVSENDVASFKQQQGVGQGVSEFLRRAIVEVLGIRVKFVARVDAAAHAKSAPATIAAPATEPAAPAAPAAGPAVPAARAAAATTVPAKAPAAQAPAARAPAVRARPTTTWATVAVPDSAPIDTPASGPAPVAEQPTPPASPPAGQSSAGQPSAQAVQPAPPLAPSRPVSLDGSPPDVEPVEEADREPEPEYEPDYSSPIVGSSAPQGTQRPQQPHEPQQPQQPHEPQASAPAAPARPVARKVTIDKARYGESVVREILGASFIEEQAVAPRVTPRID
ncbi:DNA polymerase III subunit gamma and tau [Marisediminicola antarctica]|uniref:DNA polymerase III subunit gamma/tau n=1 Tax=Marisediminicola antarctica TaxID=674079 RepID=A0A7L5ADR1_9MICO|nr:DNA polymerase III subunit gamma and tau [Marisediminicola antarctica]QHO68343.1 DNA polymerase III subunit gamma/tau [Marisediminicola antarctica]